MDRRDDLITRSQDSCRGARAGAGRCGSPHTASRSSLVCRFLGNAPRKHHESGMDHNRSQADEPGSQNKPARCSSGCLLGLPQHSLRHARAARPTHPVWRQPTGPRNRMPWRRPVVRIDSSVPTRARSGGQCVHEHAARETSRLATRIPKRYMTGISVADTRNRRAMTERRHAAPRALSFLVRQTPGRCAAAPRGSARAPPVPPPPTRTSFG
jgi:hypothetical protein